MKALGIIILMIVATLVGLFLWVWIDTPVYNHRFRLTIEAEADGVLRSGASVVAVRAVDYKYGLPEMQGVRSEVHGEAVFVDLGNGRNVIATLGFGPNGYEDRIDGLAQSAFSPSHPGLQYFDVPKLTGTAPLTGELIPTLVTFADLNDPKSARVVRPDELEKTFGPGVRFKRAYIEMVPAGIWPFRSLGWPQSLAGEPVTRGIEAKLPWLPHPRYLSGQFACSPNEPHCLHGGHFTRS